MEAVNQSREAISGCRSCKDQGLGFRVQGLGFRVHHIRFFVDCFLKFCFLCCCSIIVFLFLFLWTGWSVQWTSAECNDLWLVDPQCNYKGEEAQVMAANAASRSKLEQVHVSESLSAALKGCSMAVGFTRRIGGLRIPDIHLSNLKIPSLGDLNLALIFGREDRGLTNMELLQCTHVCSIPSGKGTGSLNLSHAVAVALSRLYEAAHQEKAEDRAVYLPQTSTAYKNLPGTASIEEVDNLIRRWEQMLLACNKITVLVDEPNYRMQERMLIHMRRMMMRAGPSLREVGFLHGFLTTVNTITSSIAGSQLKRQPHNTSQLNP